MQRRKNDDRARPTRSWRTWRLIVRRNLPAVAPVLGGLFHLIAAIISASGQ